MITIEAGAADTRERPYKVNDVKNEKGKRKYKTTYQLIDKKSGSVIAETQETDSILHKSMVPPSITEGTVI